MGIAEAAADDGDDRAATGRPERRRNRRHRWRRQVQQLPATSGRVAPVVVGDLNSHVRITEILVEDGHLARQSRYVRGRQIASHDQRRWLLISATEPIDAEQSKVRSQPNPKIVYIVISVASFIEKTHELIQKSSPCIARRRRFACPTKTLLNGNSN